MRYSCAQHSLLVGLVYAAAQMCTNVANDFAERESVPDRIEFSIENLFFLYNSFHGGLLATRFGACACAGPRPWV